MPRGRLNLAGMSIDGLITLREDVGLVLSQKSAELREQLERLGFQAESAKRGSRRGGKVAPKYRDPENPSNTWAGRGAVPRWMQQRIKAGANKEDFLIGVSGRRGRKKTFKKATRKAKKSKTTAAKAKSRSGTRKQARANAKLPRRARSNKQPADQSAQSASNSRPTESGSE
jgi:H-NS histone C-terminal domain